MCKPRYRVIEVQLPKSGDGWGVQDRTDLQVVWTGVEREQADERTENLNAWEAHNTDTKP